jgi:hypothetical protein
MNALIKMGLAFVAGLTFALIGLGLERSLRKEPPHIEEAARLPRRGPRRLPPGPDEVTLPRQQALTLHCIVEDRRDSETTAAPVEVVVQPSADTASVTLDDVVITCQLDPSPNPPGILSLRAARAPQMPHAE